MIEAAGKSVMSRWDLSRTDKERWDVEVLILLQITQYNLNFDSKYMYRMRCSPLQTQKSLSGRFDQDESIVWLQFDAKETSRIPGWIKGPWLMASRGVLSSAPWTCFSGWAATSTLETGATISAVAEGAIIGTGLDGEWNSGISMTEKGKMIDWKSQRNW